ncbi:hypothetical protein QLX08_008096 [Tetragonisca angustula]|uniref:DUF4706 domain-containing protein n=1 Tax=Tetragonisca angustula TaxID=166442 RepID=A0AAW0ZLM1_9HYME
MSAALSSRAEQYFYSINPLAQRIGEDITATKEAYEGLWNTLSIAERNQAINETIIQPEVALKYTLKKPEITKELPEWYPKLRIQTGMKYVIDETGSTLRWRDEHSAPFSFMTQSQMNLSVIDSTEDAKSKLIRAQFGESSHFSSPAKSHRNNSNSLNDPYTSSHTVNRFQSDCFSSNIFEDEQCNSLLKDDMESLVRERDSDTDKSQTNTLVVMSRTKSSDINESTALLETPSSYSSFQSSQLNQEEEERTIPKTGFEFLDNW